MKTRVIRTQDGVRKPIHGSDCIGNECDNYYTLLLSLSLSLARSSRESTFAKADNSVSENNERERVRRAISMSFQPCVVAFCSSLFFFAVFSYFCPLAVLCPKLPLRISADSRIRCVH